PILMWHSRLRGPRQARFWPVGVEPPSAVLEFKTFVDRRRSCLRSKTLCLFTPSQLQRLWFLRLVLMLIADVNLQLLAHGAAQLVLGQHSQNRFLHHAIRTTVKQLAELLFPQ